MHSFFTALVIGGLLCHISAKTLRKNVSKVRAGDDQTWSSWDDTSSETSPWSEDSAVDSSKPADSWGGSTSDESSQPSGDTADSSSSSTADPWGDIWSNGDDGDPPVAESVSEAEIPSDNLEEQARGDKDCVCMSVLKCGASLRVGVGDESDENVCPNEGDVCCLTAATSGSSASLLQCGEAKQLTSATTFLTDNQSQFGELPWTVLLFDNTAGVGRDGAFKHQCPGSLVHPRVIVTAAYCVAKKDPSSLVIRAGEWDLTDQNSEPLPHQERYVERVVVHPEYKDGGVPHNLAIVVLTEPFDLSDNVNTICLPDKYIEEVDSSHCVASGWGREPQGQQRTTIMKKITVAVMDRKQCRNAIRKHLGKYFVLDQSSICAGGEQGKDTCQGDGGGPLACPSVATGAMTLTGVTSWGVRCGESETPGIYVDVLGHVQWIKDTLADVSS